MMNNKEKNMEPYATWETTQGSIDRSEQQETLRRLRDQAELFASLMDTSRRHHVRTDPGELKRAFGTQRS